LTTRGITTSGTANVSFSYNGGVTDVAQFNQQGGTPGNFIDRNDWIYANAGCPASPPGPFIQNAFGCMNEVSPLLAPGTPEFQVLAALGYDPVAVPAPLIGFGLPAFLAIGGLLFGAKLLERSRRVAALFDVAG
jgi:hypothetical protein